MVKQTKKVKVKANETTNIIKKINLDLLIKPQEIVADLENFELYRMNILDSKNKRFYYFAQQT